jgi:hypothetical protein
MLEVLARPSAHKVSHVTRNPLTTMLRVFLILTNSFSADTAGEAHASVDGSMLGGTPE